MRYLIGLVVLIMFATVNASEHTGKVNRLFVRASDGLVYFQLNTPTPAGKPACATNSYWMIKDENSEVGKKQYAALLAAHSSGKTVTIYGANTCTRWSDGEDVNMVLSRAD